MTRSPGRPLRPDTFFIVTLTLLAFALRLVALADVPPGWRDDELINIYALSGEPLEGRFPLYFTGASGHEPLYHYLQAGLIALLGHNLLSGHLLSAFLGTLAVPLTFLLARRLFGRLTAALTTLALALSFWSLMYSRIALRHISLPPLALLAFCLLWLPLSSRRQPTGTPRRGWALPLGITLGLSLYTYPAARLLPVMLAGFALYLALFHRQRFRSVWVGYALALLVSAVLALPLAFTIAQGSSQAAAQGIGADARLVELARPLRALREGDPHPLVENTWTTLGMFHASGDPEWLYNIANRPIFNLLGGASLWAGVLLCLYRWRQPRYFFLLLWLGLGLLPTVLSVPPASLSHSILIQPLTYLLPVLFLVQAYRWLTSNPAHLGPAASLTRYALFALMALSLLTNALRDLRDYFVAWPQQDMVRFLYRADYRQAARYLDDHPELVDVAIGSTLLGPWDRLALADDLQREEVRVRLFNPAWSLLLPADLTPTGRDQEGTTIMVTSFPALDPALAGLLGRSPLWEAGGLRRYRAPQALPSPALSPASPALFANGLELVGALWPEGAAPGREATLWLVWQVARPLELPPLPIVANPPPPGVYNGPRLAVFTHLLAADGAFIAGDDGLWVDPSTLWPGDRFIQVHRFSLPPGAPPGGYMLEVGLYDPLTEERWALLDAGGQAVADYLLLPAGESEP
jgi:4-amino-4-deoxy-L-arabinose transferase-like glycosyltransferase